MNSSFISSRPGVNLKRMHQLYNVGLIQNVVGDIRATSVSELRKSLHPDPTYISFQITSLLKPYVGLNQKFCEAVNPLFIYL